MTNNDVLRRFRYALDIKDSVMIEIFNLAGDNVERGLLLNLLKKEDEQGFIDCSDKILTNFFNGFIIYKRGEKEDKTGKPRPVESLLNNNLILKKIRIALELREGDIIEILNAADVKVSGSELTALFRRREHRNYKPCGDQFLRNFLTGLTKKYR